MKLDPFNAMVLFGAIAFVKVAGAAQLFAAMMLSAAGGTDAWRGKEYAMHTGCALSIFLFASGFESGLRAWERLSRKPEPQETS